MIRFRMLVMIRFKRVIMIRLRALVMIRFRRVVMIRLRVLVMIRFRRVVMIRLRVLVMIRIRLTATWVQPYWHLMQYKAIKRSHSTKDCLKLWLLI